MTLEVHYLGRLPFYGDRVRKLIKTLAGEDATFGSVARNRDDLNALVRAIRGSASPALILSPIAPAPMLADVSPAAAAIGMDSVELAIAFREKLGNQHVPMLLPLAGKAFSDPAIEVERLATAGIENAMVVLAPNLAGASDIIANPAFRVPKATAESILAAFIAGNQRGRPATSLAALARNRRQPIAAASATAR